MSFCVLDCSATKAWCPADEATPKSNALLREVGQHGAVVPTLWYWEVANVLTLAVRRGRITVGDYSALQAMLEALQIQHDPAANHRAWTMAAQLAPQHDLSVYDAAYLDLALLRSLPLATTHKALTKAARTAGVALAL